MSPLLLLIFCALSIPGVIGDCYDDPANNNKTYGNCDTCYQTLANALINTGDNKYQLGKSFFPDKQPQPIEVRVKYVAVPESDINGDIEENDTTIWYWLAGEFYIFQPLELFLYRSLYFSPPSWRKEEVTLYLPETCLANSSREFNNEFLHFLTQRLKVYAATQTVQIEIDDSDIGASVNGDQRKTYNAQPLEGKLHHGIIPAVYAVPFGVCAIVILIFSSLFGVCIYIVRNPNDNEASDFFRMQLKIYARKVSDSVKLQANLVATTTLCNFSNCYVFSMFVKSLIVEASGNLPSYYKTRGDFLGMNIVLCLIFAIYIVLGLFFCLWFNIELCFESKRRKYVGFLAMTMCVGTTMLGLSFHFQNILIAWTIVPFYAGKISIHYGIIFFMLFISLKYVYEYALGAMENKDNIQKGWCYFGVVVVVIVLFVFEVIILAVIALYIIYLPINHSIEDSAIGITTIYHGSVLIIGSLIAYNVGGQYIGGPFELNVALNKAMEIIKWNPSDIGDPDWKFDSFEKRMSKLVKHYFERNTLEQTMFSSRLRNSAFVYDANGQPNFGNWQAVKARVRIPLRNILNPLVVGLNLDDTFRNELADAIINSAKPNDQDEQNANNNDLNDFVDLVHQYLAVVNKILAMATDGNLPAGPSNLGRRLTRVTQFMMQYIQFFVQNNDVLLVEMDTITTQRQQNDGLI